MTLEAIRSRKVERAAAMVSLRRALLCEMATIILEEKDVAREIVAYML